MGKEKYRRRLTFSVFIWAICLIVLIDERVHWWVPRTRADPYFWGEERGRTSLQFDICGKPVSHTWVVQNEPELSTRSRGSQRSAKRPNGKIVTEHSWWPRRWTRTKWQGISSRWDCWGGVDKPHPYFWSLRFDRKSDRCTWQL